MNKKFLSLIAVVVFSFMFASLCCAQTPYVRQISKTDCPRDSLLLVSWNGGNFGRSKTDETLEYMAKLLRNTDIIAIQEVSTTNFGAQTAAKLADNLNRLGSKWDYAVSNQTHEGTGKERYVFFWKTSAIKAVLQKPVIVSALSEVMVREPAKMTFSRGDKKFTLASFHLAPTAHNPKAEVAAMVAFAGAFSEENLIFVGDFNLGSRDLDPVFNNVFKMTHYIEGKTSLKQENKNGDYFSQAYDNVYVRGNFKIHKSAIVDFVSDFPVFKHARKVSDHLPVFIVFSLN